MSRPTGVWPAWQERWDGLVEAIEIIRGLWSGEPIDHQGQYYRVNARLYDPPPQPIPILTAANGKKAMRLAGQVQPPGPAEISQPSVAESALRNGAGSL